MPINCDICYIAVRINCSSNSGGQKQGTGTIIKDSGRYFVMTAAHCIIGKDNKRYQRNDIRISMILGKDNEIELDVDDVVEFDVEDEKTGLLLKFRNLRLISNTRELDVAIMQLITLWNYSFLWFY